MKPRFSQILVVLIACALLSTCTSVSGQRTAATTSSGGYGTNPTVAKPRPTLVPTINIAEAKGWPGGAPPKPAMGLMVNAVAGGLDHPRWLYVMPNGDVLVAETNAPTRRKSASACAKFS